MHRTFLKSGSARVVLTIRPGFETDFVSFLETGTLDGLPSTHPYMSIAEEMQAYANTNYPGIRSANPIDDARPLLSPLQKKAWGQMEGIIKLLEQYKTANGAYPTTAQGLAALSGLGTVPPKDPWGNDWRNTAHRVSTATSNWSAWAPMAPGRRGRGRRHHELGRRISRGTLVRVHAHERTGHLVQRNAADGLTGAP